MVDEPPRGAQDYGPERHGARHAASDFLPSRVFAQARKNTLVLGIDISDTITLDPARLAQYTSPMTVSAAYDSLVTMKPGEYINVAPSLATKWARTPDGKGWRFTLRDDVKFPTGNVMTVEDVKWSFDRVINLGDQPSQYIGHVDRVEIVDKSTIDIILKLPAEPLLSIIAAPEFVVLERKVAEANGGTADKDAKTKDKLTTWLNSNSCGTGAYRIAAWERNQQIQLVRNEHYWAGKPPFERIVIRHISDGAAQLLAVRRGDIDAAFNLIPEQIAALKTEPNVRLAPLASLDFVYMALTQEPEFNKALAVKEAAPGDRLSPSTMTASSSRCSAAPRCGRRTICRSASAARRRRSHARSDSSRISPRRRNCSPRPAFRTASSSRSSTATPPCRA